MARSESSSFDHGEIWLGQHRLAGPLLWDRCSAYWAEVVPTWAGVALATLTNHA